MSDSYEHILLSQDFFPAVGGAHLWLYEVYKRWPYHVRALVRDYSGDKNYRTRQNEFDFKDHGSLTIHRQLQVFSDLSFFVPSFYKKIFNNYRLISRLAGKKTVVLHNLRAYPEAFVAAFCKKLSNNKIKLVTYAHGEEIITAQTSRQLTWMARFAYSSSDCIIANSYSTKRLLEDFSPHANIQVINPGVDYSSFRVSVEEVRQQRQRWGYAENDIVLVSISRMEPRKNHAQVLNATAKLRALGLPIVCIFASEGEEKGHLLSQAKKLGLENYVRFPGYICDKERVLSFTAADIHVLPSIQSGSMIEGYGIVFIEAAAAGTPSIAGSVGGQAEAVLDGKTGIVIDGTDQQKLTSAIRILAEDSELRQRMGQAGRAWARKNDWKLISKKSFDLLANQDLT